MKFKIYCHSKKRLLSVIPLEGGNKGRVVAHAEQLLVRDSSFEVSAAGRARVLSTKRKHVHAWIEGEIDALWGATLRDNIDNDTIRGLGVGKPFMPIEGTPVRYNPYVKATFFRADNEAPVKGAKRLLLGRCVMEAEGLH